MYHTKVYIIVYHSTCIHCMSRLGVSGSYKVQGTYYRLTVLPFTPDVDDRVRSRLPWALALRLLRYAIQAKPYRYMLLLRTYLQLIGYHIFISTYYYLPLPRYDSVSLNLLVFSPHARPLKINTYTCPTVQAPHPHS